MSVPLHAWSLACAAQAIDALTLGSFPLRHGARNDCHSSVCSRRSTDSLGHALRSYGR